MGAIAIITLSGQLPLLISWLDGFASGLIGEPGMQDRRGVRALAAARRRRLPQPLPPRADGSRGGGCSPAPLRIQSRCVRFGHSPAPHPAARSPHTPNGQSCREICRDINATVCLCALRLLWVWLCAALAMHSEAPSSQSWASWSLIEAWACMHECRHPGMPPALWSHCDAPQPLPFVCAARYGTTPAF